MKRFFLLATALIFAQMSLGQVAVITSADGYANIRASQAGNNKIVDHVKTFQVILAFNDGIGVSEVDEVWSEAIGVREPMSLMEGNSIYDNYIMGNIHTSQYKSIDELADADPKDFQFEYTHRPFTKEGKTISYHQGSQAIDKINGEHYFGSDCGFPQEEVARAVATIGNKKVEIPQKLLWGVLHAGHEFTVKTFKGHYYVYQGIGDGSCFTYLVWHFDKNGLVQRFVGWPY